MRLSRFVRRLGADDGFTMVLVIGAISLISVLAVSGYVLASQSLHETGRLQTESRAFQAASSGMDKVLASFDGNPGNFEGPTTQGDRYRVAVTYDGSFQYSVISTGTSQGETAVVRQDFFFMDLWGTSIQAVNNGGKYGSAGSWNGGSTIRGPFYIAGAVDMNSNLDLIGGPLFVSGGNAAFKGGVNITPGTSGVYRIYCSGTVSGVSNSSTVKIYTTAPKIELPWTDPEYMDLMRQEAKDQSKDNMIGLREVSNQEVTSRGNSTYKYVPGNLTINGSTASFGQINTAASPAYWDDFAYDTSTDTLYIEGVVFVEGDVTLGTGIRAYKGNGCIVTPKGITVSTGTFLQPVGGDANPDDLSATAALALVSGGDINLESSSFEGVVFANGALNLNRTGGWTTTMHGPIHANAINSNDTHNEIAAEELPDGSSIISVLPYGVPGGPTDPRGGEYTSIGKIIPGTWSRVQ